MLVAMRHHGVLDMIDLGQRRIWYRLRTKRSLHKADLVRSLLNVYLVQFC